MKVILISIFIVATFTAMCLADPYSDCSVYGNCKESTTTTVNFNNNTGAVNSSTYTYCWITAEGIKCDVADITYDEISGGDVNAAGYTGYFAFLSGTVGGIDMTGNPWWLSGTDLELERNLQVNGNISGNWTGDLLPTLTLAYNLGSGANRWNYLYVRNISAEEIDTFDIHVSQNLTVDGYINDVNVSNFSNTYVPYIGATGNIYFGNITLYADSIGIESTNNVTITGGYVNINGNDYINLNSATGVRIPNGAPIYIGPSDQVSIQPDPSGQGMTINPREVGAGNLTVLGGINTSYQVNALSYTGNGSQLTGVADSGNCAGGSAVQNATDTGLQCIGSLAITNKNNVFTKDQNITTGGLYMSSPMTKFVMGHATGFGYPVYLQLASPNSAYSIFRIYSNISGSFNGVTDIFSNGLQKWYMQNGAGIPMSQISYVYAGGSNGAITFTNNTGSLYRAEVGGLLYGGLYLTSSLTSTQGTNFVYVYPTNLTLKGLPLYSNNAITATNYSVNTLAGISTNVSLTNSTGSACYMNFTKGLLTGSNC